MKVVHRDVKASNVLLDNNWEAKLGDYALAKLLGRDEMQAKTRVMGTFGSVAHRGLPKGLASSFVTELLTPNMSLGSPERLCAPSLRAFQWCYLPAAVLVLLCTPRLPIPLDPPLPVPLPFPLPLPSSCAATWPQST